jgi:hypothetical protein
MSGVDQSAELIKIFPYIQLDSFLTCHPIISIAGPKAFSALKKPDGPAGTAAANPSIPVVLSDCLGTPSFGPAQTRVL